MSSCRPSVIHRSFHWDVLLITLSLVFGLKSVQVRRESCPKCPHKAFRLHKSSLPGVTIKTNYPNFTFTTVSLTLLTSLLISCRFLIITGIFSQELFFSGAENIIKNNYKDKLKLIVRNYTEINILTAWQRSPADYHGASSFVSILNWSGKSLSFYIALGFLFTAVFTLVFVLERLVIFTVNSSLMTCAIALDGEYFSTFFGKSVLCGFFRRIWRGTTL